MATKEASNASKKKFAFKKGFMDSFDVLVKTYTNSLDALNKAATGKEFKSEYGICACTYDMRYITPSNMSTYIGNLIKGLNSGLFKDRIGDVEIFTVASVRKFMEENDCKLFDEDAPVKADGGTITPKEMTLNDLAIMCYNDNAQVCVYSKGEAAKRGQLMMPDIKKINDMHFAANIKKIVNSIPEILEKSEDGMSIIGAPAFSMIFERFLEEFVIFACTVNIICVLNMYAYIHPSVEYNRTDVDGSVVTEAYMCKTNDFMIRSRIPFNCNLRDIALQDVTPDFKDLHDALHFIMKDARSPIAILVNKYASADRAVYRGDCELVSRIFLGHSHEHCCDDVYKKDGERVIGGGDPIGTVAGFDTNVDWLDTIVFGNNYLDGNYRKDAVGNNNVHPIMNTLDMIYKMFGGQEYKSNEDIANNIIRNACLMKGIIHNYNQGTPLENYDLTKDVLVLIGEIITRNMLRLYYNNTPVISYTDDMCNAGPMPMITLEEFVMEADANTANAANNNAPKTETTISVNGQTTSANKAVNGGGISGFIKKLINWVKTQLNKFSGNFEKQYKAYIDEVNKNKALNDEIASVIGVSWKPAISGPNYSLKIDSYNSPVTNIKQLYDQNKLDENYLVCRMMGIPEEGTNRIINASKSNTTDKKANISDALFNYMLYGGSVEPVKYENTPVTKGIWGDIQNNLLGSIQFTKDFQDKMNKNIEAAAKAVEDFEKLMTDEKDEQKKNAMNTKMTDIKNALTRATTWGAKNSLMLIGNKFFSENYKAYKGLLNFYKQTHTENNQSTSVSGEANQTQAANNGGTPAVDQKGGE